MERYIERIALALKDYRIEDCLNLDRQHIIKWIDQFDSSVQLPMLRELSYIIEQCYLSRVILKKSLLKIINSSCIHGGNLRKFWENAILLNIQQNGHSQREILNEFTLILQEKYGILPKTDSLNGRIFVYLDDFLFHGNRVSRDLQNWLQHAPDNIFIYICLIGCYKYGLYNTEKRITEMIENSNKNIKFGIYSFYQLENRQFQIGQADTYWPTQVPNHQLIQKMLIEDPYPFKPRPSGLYKGNIFNKEADRKILEDQLLQAGIYIYSLPQNENKYLRPLGFSGFGLGFGSTIITYRNCPNNAPLALWWGSLDERDAYPLCAWYPLFPRKPY